MTYRPSPLERRLYGLRVEPHFVYVARDGYGDPLYIGCTVDLPKRLHQHRKHRSPWIEVAVEIEAHKYPDFRSARHAEKWAIRTLRPSFNLVQMVQADTPYDRSIRRVGAPSEQIRLQRRVTPGGHVKWDRLKEVAA